MNSIQRIDREGVQADVVFRDIAENLFKHCVIRKGEETFRFLEIEFYYHSDKHPDDFVYPRNCSVAGSFLIHSSGVDICFKNVDERTYGGILIRHLLRIDEGQSKAVVAGSWDCCDALFDYSNEAVHPYLAEADNDFDATNLKSTSRFNAKGNMPEKHYCFYDAGYKLRDANDWGENATAFERYNPTMKTRQKNTYNSKPWNRK